jgi:hypothetical protein
MDTKRGSRKPSAVARKAVIDILNARRELKYFEFHTSSTLSSGGGIVALSQPIVQGDTAGTRDGESINMAYLDIHWELNLAAAGTRAICRLIIFTDSQAQGVLPTVTGSTNGILTRADENACYDFPVAIHHRFKILYDESVCLSSAGIVCSHIKRKIKLGNHKVVYLDPTSVAVANGQGAVYALLIEDSVVNATAVDLSVAMAYYDS